MFIDILSIHFSYSHSSIHKCADTHAYKYIKMSMYILDISLYIFFGTFMALNIDFHNCDSL